MIYCVQIWCKATVFVVIFITIFVGFVLKLFYQKEKIMKVKPLFDRVLILPQEKENVSKFGIVLPSTAQEKPQMGEVVAIGTGGMLDGSEIVMQVSVGQKVLYNKYAGSELKLDDENFVILRQSDIVGILED